MIRRVLRRLAASTEGSAAIEFALIGPAMIGMMLGVLQVGVAMQNYNALRSVATDIGRYTVVQYQTGNKVTDDTIKTYGRSKAIRMPYGLTSSRFAIAVDTVGTSPITGTTQKNLTLTYSLPTFLSILGVPEVPITYSQPIFIASS